MTPTANTSPPGCRPQATSRLIWRWQTHGDIRARDEVMQRFLPLARRLARRYANPNEPLEDLVQVAAVGLLAALRRFDINREIDFDSFAIPTIVGELKRHFRDTGWGVHVPRKIQESAARPALPAPGAGAAPPAHLRRGEASGG